MTLFCDGVGSNVPFPTRSIDSGVMRGAITLVPPPYDMGPEMNIIPCP